MFYVYLLQSVDSPNQLYIGQTIDLKRRLIEHNAGRNTSTKRYKPWKVVYYEAYPYRDQAIEREAQLKHYGQARTVLKKRLQLI